MIDQHVTVEKTTLADLRRMFGTPTVMGETEAGESVVGFAFTGHNNAASFFRNFGKSAATFGFGSTKSEFTQKHAFFKLDANNVVTACKKNGVAYLMKHRISHWNECEAALTDAEINSPVVYSDAEICQQYQVKVAREKGIAPSAVDTDEETKFCNIPCQARRGLVKAFGPLKTYNDLVDKTENDGADYKKIFF